MKVSHACQDSMQRIRRSTVLERRKSELSLILRNLMTQYFKNDKVFFKVFTDSIFYSWEKSITRKKNQIQHFIIQFPLYYLWSCHFRISENRPYEAFFFVFFFSIASVCLRFRFFTNLVKSSASGEITLRLSRGFYLFMRVYAWRVIRAKTWTLRVKVT